MEALIEINDLSRFYGQFCAVDSISFQLQAGEVLGFLGPNGAGKSTTIQMICGTLAPSAGNIKICGTDLLEQPDTAKLNLGYLPETPPLYPDLTVDEYLAYSAQLRQLKLSNIASAMERVKQQCGLTERGSQLISTLSKGYQQRLGIAQAIIHNPKVIVLDEPTSGLDPNQIHEIHQLIRQLAENSGILISSHILPEVQMLCDRVQILHKGKLIYAQQVDQQPAGDTIQIQLEQPQSIDAINKLPSVALATEQRETAQFNIQLADHASTAQLAKEIVAQGWGLTQLQTKRQDLEHTFFRLTQGDIG